MKNCMMSDKRMTNENFENKQYPINGLRICIDQGGETLAGRMYSKMTEEEIEFESTGKMLLMADDLFDRYGYP